MEAEKFINLSVKEYVVIERESEKKIRISRLNYLCHGRWYA